MIKNIVFDLGGVIVPLNKIACIRAFDEIVGYHDFANMLSLTRQTGFFDKYERGFISSKEFRNFIRKNSGSKSKGLDKKIEDREIDYSLNCFLKDIPQNKINTINFFKQDYRIFILSNTNPIGMTYVHKLFREKGYEIEDLFEMLFLSYEMKTAKPDRDIFEKMIFSAKIIPNETLYIDDGLANCHIANELGFHTIFYDPKTDLYDEILKFL
ncbi:MAG: HAD family phosphatase [Bacteroidales bacterium]